jgi:hypothetical protein
MHPMELEGDLGHVESRFSPFGDGVNDLRQTYHRLRIILDVPVGTPR